MGYSILDSRVCALPTGTNGSSQWMVLATGPGRREGSESNATRTVHTGFTLHKILFNIEDNPKNGDVVVNVRRNGGDSGMSVTIDAASTGEFESTGGPIDFAQGDTVALEFDCSAVSSGDSILGWMGAIVEYAGETVIVVCSTGGANNTPSATEYIPLVHLTDWGQHSLAECRTKTKWPCTVRNMQVRVPVNNRTTNNVITVVVDGSPDTALEITFGSGENGEKSDTSGSVAVAADGDICTQMVTGTGTELIEPSFVIYELVFDNPGQFMRYMGSNAAGQEYAPGPGVTEYWHHGGSYREAETPASEAIAQHDALLSQKVEHFTAFLKANGISAASVVTLRRDGADGNQAITLTASTAGYFESAAADPTYFDPTDEMATEWATGGSGTTLTVLRSALAVHLVPDRPTGITEDSKTSSSVQVSATDETSGAQPHHWFYAPTGQTPIFAGQTPAGESPLDWNFTGLSASTTYDFWCAAYDPVTDELSQLTGPLTVTTVAAAPTAASISEGGDGDHTQNDVQIDSFDGAATEHDLYRGTSSIAGDAENLGTLVENDVDVSGGAPVEVLEPATEGTTYFYVLVSRNAAGATESNELQIVTADGPEVTLAPTALAFSATEGGGAPADKTFNIENTGDVSLDWTATETAGWLTLSKTSGTLAPGADEDVTVSCDPTGLSEGSYQAAITVSDPDAPGAPQDVDVTFTITALAAGLSHGLRAAAGIVPPHRRRAAPRSTAGTRS